MIMSTGPPSKSVTQKRIEAGKPVYQSSRPTMQKQGDTNTKAMYKARDKSAEESEKGIVLDEMDLKRKRNNNPDIEG